MEREPGANTPDVRIDKHKFVGHVVLITGAAAGLGEATARLFARQGAAVMAIDVDKAKLDEVVADINAQYQERFDLATAWACDLTIEEDVSHTVNAIIARHNKIDALIHIAGIYPRHSLTNHPSSLYHKIMQVNMDTTFYLVRAILPHMQQAGYGRIVTTASGTILLPMADASAYVAAKSAIVGFTRVIAVEAGAGITANAIAPGLMITATGWDGGKASEMYETLRVRQAVKRNGIPDDIAHAASYLASPEAAFVTGQCLEVGGGMTFR